MRSSTELLCGYLQKLKRLAIAAGFVVGFVGPVPQSFGVAGIGMQPVVFEVRDSLWQQGGIEAETEYGVKGLQALGSVHKNPHLERFEMMGYGNGQSMAMIGVGCAAGVAEALC